MRRIVAKNSTEKYNLENVKLLLWLYNEEDLREEVLQDSFVDRLNEASPSRPGRGRKKEVISKSDRSRKPILKVGPVRSQTELTARALSSVF